MTFSIVARDPDSGDLGVAVASKFLAVGSVVPHAQAGLGAIATQALANVRYGSEGIELLAHKLSAAEVVERLTAADDGAAHRQLGIVDAQGRAATFSGRECMAWAGGRTADNVAVQGNILAGASVVDAMLEIFVTGGQPFPELLLAALSAGDAEGGDRRGRESAALLVVREGGGYGGATDRWIDLRVDDHPMPIEELGRLLDINHLLMDRPAAEDLIPVDEALAAELQRLLTAAGFSAENVGGGGGLTELLEAQGIQRTGEPRPVPASWTPAWEKALGEWMGVENLEERMTAPGWIDPRVLDYMRTKTAG